MKESLGSGFQRLESPKRQNLGPDTFCLDEGLRFTGLKLRFHVRSSLRVIVYEL